MRRVRPTGPFKKDLERAAKRRWNLGKIHRTIALLQENAPLPLTARPHRISGEWEGYWECHIEFDWILIYGITGGEVVLVRTSTHADLFE